MKTESTEFLRYVFTRDERLQMGSDLASAHNQLASIDEEEAVVKSQFKERRATVQQMVAALSRNLENGFEMRNIKCRLQYDDPRPLEVTYYRTDTGEAVKTRPLTEDERQAELPLDDAPADEGQVKDTIKQSQANVNEFFGKSMTTADHLETPEPIEPKTDQPEDDDEDTLSEDDPASENEAGEPGTTAAIDWGITDGSITVKEDNSPEGGGKKPETESGLFAQAVRIVVTGKKAGASLLQEKLSITYSQAAHLITALESHGVISRGDDGHLTVLKDKAWLDGVISEVASESKPPAPATKKKPLRKHGFVAQEPENPESW